MSNFFRDLTCQKSLKSVNFWQSYSKNKRWTFLGQYTCVDCVHSKLRPVSHLSPFAIFVQFRRASLSRDELAYATATNWTTNVLSTSSASKVLCRSTHFSFSDTTRRAVHNLPMKLAYFEWYSISVHSRNHSTIQPLSGPQSVHI